MNATSGILSINERLRHNRKFAKLFRFLKLIEGYKMNRIWIILFSLTFIVALKREGKIVVAAKKDGGQLKGILSKCMMYLFLVLKLYLHDEYFISCLKARNY